MDLHVFLNRPVFVQFRDRNWMMACVDKQNRPTLAFIEQPDPGPQPARLVVSPNDPPQVSAAKQIVGSKPGPMPIQLPFAQGVFVERLGEILFRYQDSATKLYMETMFHEDVIFSVTAVDQPETEAE